MLRAFEARDHNAINNPVEASIIAEVLQKNMKICIESKRKT